MRLEPTRPAAPVSPAAVLPARDGDVEQVMLRYQDMMRRIVEAQQEIMLAYLQPRSAVADELQEVREAPAITAPEPLSPSCHGRSRRRSRDHCRCAASTTSGACW